MSYQKRQKGHWNEGKAYKGNRKAREKLWAKKEIEEQQAEVIRHKSKRRRDRKKSAEHQLEKYSRLLKQAKHASSLRFYQWMVADAKKKLSKWESGKFPPKKGTTK